MKKYDYVFGPVPSRRLGLSLGVSPIPEKTCNYSCVYCQLGRTNHMTNQRANYIDVDHIIEELKSIIDLDIEFDVVSLVGEGEPTLNSELGRLIREIHRLTPKPVAVITNGSLFNQEEVRRSLMEADIVLPSFDAFDEESFKLINRPHGSLNFDDVFKGLIEFSKIFTGQLWLEIMIIKGMNDSEEAIERFKDLISHIDYDRLYINTPIRPPAEEIAQPVDHESIKRIMDSLGGISIDYLESIGFYSAIADDMEALKSILSRHPMTQGEVSQFLSLRKCGDIMGILKRLEEDEYTQVIEYMGYKTYRTKMKDK